MLFEKILHNNKPLEFYFRMCTNCGFVYFALRPRTKDMVIKYRLINEWGSAKAQDKNRHSHVRTYDDKRAFKIHKIVCSVQEVKNSNVADIGGSEGRNLKYFVKDNSCFVVDYERRELIDGVKYLCETAEDIPEAIRFSTVLYCHILEHMVDPVKEVTRIKGILEPNGLLYIEVPLGCWGEWKHTRNFLTHINFFSQGSLWYLLDACGLSIRYLKARPSLVRTGYDPRVIVAIAEKAGPRNKKVAGYQLTCREMQSMHFFLRLHGALLNLQLQKVKYLKKLLKRIILKVRKA